MKTNYKEILGLLDTYKLLGEIKLDDGTLLIGKAQHIAPKAWLHSIYPPLVDSEIEGLERKLGAKIPENYRVFLKESNGLKLFNTTFCLDGLRKNYRRAEQEVWQPFDICIPNVSERPQNAKSSFFFIGGYDWDGSLLFTDGGKVFLCNREDAKPLYEWSSFEEMLSSEIKRLMTLFDKNGKALNADHSTLPVIV